MLGGPGPQPGSGLNRHFRNIHCMQTFRAYGSSLADLPIFSPARGQT